MLQICWIDTYLGPPDLITHDAGKNFVSKEFKTYAKAMSISTRSIPIEAHNLISMIKTLRDTMVHCAELTRLSLLRSLILIKKSRFR
jgi:hypothetical protein